MQGPSDAQLMFLGEHDRKASQNNLHSEAAVLVREAPNAMQCECQHLEKRGMESSRERIKLNEQQRQEGKEKRCEPCPG